MSRPECKKARARRRGDGTSLPIKDGYPLLPRRVKRHVRFRGVPTHANLIDRDSKLSPCYSATAPCINFRSDFLSVRHARMGSESYRRPPQVPCRHHITSHCSLQLRLGRCFFSFPPSASRSPDREERGIQAQLADSDQPPHSPATPPRNPEPRLLTPVLDMSNQCRRWFNLERITARNVINLRMRIWVRSLVPRTSHGSVVGVHPNVEHEYDLSLFPFARDLARDPRSRSHPGVVGDVTAQPNLLKR